MHLYQARKEDMERSYPCACEPWGIFGPEALAASRAWLKGCLGTRYESFQAADDEGNVVGEILWAWSEKSLSFLRTEPQVAIISCVWVKSQNQGRGVWKGMLRALSDDLVAQGAKGIMVAATDYEGYMHRDYFRKAGFRVLGEREGTVVMFYPLGAETVEYGFTEEHVPPGPDDKVAVHIFRNLLCPIAAELLTRIERIAKEFSDRVQVIKMESSREALERHGAARGPYINGKPSFLLPKDNDVIRKLLKEEVKRYDLSDCAHH